MLRRDVIGKCGSTIAAASALGLAGCAGDGGSDNPDDGDGGDETTAETTTTETGMDATTDTAAETTTETPAETTTDTPTETTTSTVDAGSDEYDTEERGAIVENAVDELAILGWTSEVKQAITGNEEFVVTLVIENRGDVVTSTREYNYELAYYDESGSTLQEGRAAYVNDGPIEIGPGERGRVGIWLNGFENDEAVASYDVALNCRFADDAAYCD